MIWVVFLTSVDVEGREGSWERERAQHPGQPLDRGRRTRLPSQSSPKLPMKAVPYTKQAQGSLVPSATIDDLDLLPSESPSLVRQDSFPGS